MYIYSFVNDLTVFSSFKKKKRFNLKYFYNSSGECPLVERPNPHFLGAKIFYMQGNPSEHVNPFQRPHLTM